MKGVTAMAKTNIARWGNSKAVRIPKMVLEIAELGEGDIVEVTAEDGKIMIKKVAARKTVQEILDSCAESFRRDSADWEKPMSDEALQGKETS
jgi:antitoxin MazE